MKYLADHLAQYGAEGLKYTPLLLALHTRTAAICAADTLYGGRFAGVELPADPEDRAPREDVRYALAVNPRIHYGRTPLWERAWLEHLRHALEQVGLDFRVWGGYFTVDLDDLNLKTLELLDRLRVASADDNVAWVEYALSTPQYAQMRDSEEANAYAAYWQESRVQGVFTDLPAPSLAAFYAATDAEYEEDEEYFILPSSFNEVQYLTDHAASLAAQGGYEFPTDDAIDAHLAWLKNRATSEAKGTSLWSNRYAAWSAAIATYRLDPLVEDFTDGSLHRRSAAILTPSGWATRAHYETIQLPLIKE